MSCIRLYRSAPWNRPWVWFLYDHDAKVKSDNTSAFRLSAQLLDRITDNLLSSSLTTHYAQIIVLISYWRLAITQNLLRSHDSKLDFHMIVTWWWDCIVQACYSIIEKRFNTIICLAINPNLFWFSDCQNCDSSICDKPKPTYYLYCTIHDWLRITWKPGLRTMPTGGFDKHFLLKIMSSGQITFHL